MPIYSQALDLLLFGTGQDGAATFDGSSVVLGLTPSSGVYTLTRDIFCTTLTNQVASTLRCRGFRIFCSEGLVNAGTIESNGNAAVTSTGAVAISATGVYLCVGAAGGNGRSDEGAGTAGTSSGGANVAGGNGGAGGTAGGANTGGAAGAGAAQNVVVGGKYNVLPWLWGRFPGTTAGATPTILNGGGGGGGGGCDPNTGTAVSGGGGGGAMTMGIFARSFNNTGSITATGGAGAAASFTGDGVAGGGGGGPGGAIAIVTQNMIAQGTITAAGGAGGAGANGGGAGTTGESGSVIIFS